jgi:hypothetical protein
MVVVRVRMAVVKMLIRCRGRSEHATFLVVSDIAVLVIV